MNPINYKLSYGTLSSNDSADLHDGPCWVGQIFVSSTIADDNGGTVRIMDGTDTVFLIHLTGEDEGVRSFVIPCIPGGGYQFHTKLVIATEDDPATSCQYAIQYNPIG